MQVAWRTSRPSRVARCSCSVGVATFSSCTSRPKRGALIRAFATSVCPQTASQWHKRVTYMAYNPFLCSVA